MPSQSPRRRRSRLPSSGSKPAAPPGPSVLDHIYANPEEVEEATNQDEIASVLKILLEKLSRTILIMSLLMIFLS